MPSVDETIGMQRELLTKALQLLSTAMDLQGDLEQQLSERPQDMIPLPGPLSDEAGANSPAGSAPNTGRLMTPTFARPEPGPIILGKKTGPMIDTDFEDTLKSNGSFVSDSPDGRKASLGGLAKATAKVAADKQASRSSLAQHARATLRSQEASESQSQAPHGQRRAPPQRPKPKQLASFGGSRVGSMSPSPLADADHAEGGNCSGAALHLDGGPEAPRRESLLPVDQQAWEALLPRPSELVLEGLDERFGTS